MRTNQRSTLAVVAAAAGAVFFLGSGVWAFADPASFYAAVAEFPPFNAHFLRDLGAFQIGLGATLLAALWLRDGLTVALAGVAAGAVMHVVGHVIDHDLGGSYRDTVALGVFAVLLIAGAVAQHRRATG